MRRRYKPGKAVRWLLARTRMQVLLTVYLSGALLSASLFGTSVSPCVAEDHRMHPPGAGETAFVGFFAGLLWPLVLPAGVVAKEDHHGNYCF